MNIIIIGGGAAGMMCAARLISKENKVILFDHNEKLGKKLFITGKGRGNLTNSADREEFLKNVVSNPKFMYSSFNAFDNVETESYFNTLGLKTKTERGGRVFPLSDHAYEISDVLKNAMKKNNIEVKLNEGIKDLIIAESKIQGVISDKGKKYTADRVVVATGGRSYPQTGSTGDGYTFAKKAGLKITEISPSLVPFNADLNICKKLQGLSLKNVNVSVTLESGKKLYEEFGEMLFTHFGVSGPVILTASAKLDRKYLNEKLFLHIDLKPALDNETLDKRLINIFKENHNKQYKNSINSLFPSKLIPLIIELSGIDPEKECNRISHEERRKLLNLIKDLKISLKGFRGFEEAIITKGGVSVKEINPKSMESKKIKGLYFIGEIIDVDALTGGFNLQLAWSTAAAAAKSILGNTEE
ncbi:MAG: NAD(P)/FAD-dependent oxidoreductase [Lachnospiraceae bacterium]|nr:NAD(P)/FAD-dependent oxidoreductase [Lachnospiraceae bacterium]